LKSGTNSYLRTGVFAVLIGVTQIANAQIIIDGEFSDWADIETVTKSDAFVREVKLTDDEKYLYGYFQVADSISIQSFNGRVSILFITGSDSLKIIFSRQDNLQTRTYVHTGFGTGIGYQRYDHFPLDPSHKLNLIVLPSHQSRRFEFRIEKRRDNLFKENTGLDVQILFTVNDLTSELEPVYYKLRNHSFTAFSQPLQKGENDVRLLTWNVMGDKLKNYSTFKKIIDAANPDIVMLEEVYEDIQPEKLQEYFFPSEWHISISDNGFGKTVIASRYPHEYLKWLSSIEYPSDNIRDLINEQPVGSQWMSENNSDGVSSSGAVIKIGDRGILFVLVGLTCCGHGGSWEDTMRILESSLLSERIQKLLSEREVPVIISGDLNLVGSVKPLEILRNSKSPPLKVQYMLQHSDRTAYTWRTLGESPFGPGRLDYVLVDQSLESSGLILKLEDLLSEEELECSSDHYPIITDFKKP